MPEHHNPDSVLSRFEFEDELLRDGFTSMPNTVLYYQGISMGAKATYLVLLSYAWREMRAWPGQETMAAQLGIGVRTIRNYLKELEAHGIIKIRQRGLTMTSDVVFLRLGHLRAAKSAAQERQAPRTARAAESARPERHRLPTKNDKRITTKAVPLPEIAEPEETASVLWSAALDQLRGERISAGNLSLLADLPVSLDQGTLIVRCPVDLVGKWDSYIRRALGDRFVKFISR